VVEMLSISLLQAVVAVEATTQAAALELADC
jgi:hypothetical protein